MNNYPQNSGYVQPPVSTPIPPTPTSAPDKKRNTLLTIMVALVLIISIANTAFIAMLYVSDKALPAKDQMAETKAYNTYIEQIADDSLEITNFKLNLDEEGYGDFSYDIENTSNETLYDIYVYYNLYDENKNFIGSTYSFISHIDGNATINFTDYTPQSDVHSVTVFKMTALKESDIY